MSCSTGLLRSLGSAQFALRCFSLVRRLRIALVCALAALPCAAPIHAQSGTATSDAQTSQAAPDSSARPAEIGEPATDDVLRLRLTGKTLYLRGGYLENVLDFDENGNLIGHSPQGSYTLCLIQIDRIRLTRHKVLLTGARYGLHFLGATPNEDPARVFDTVNITPKKKPLRISIAREIVVKPKKKKGGKDSSSGPADSAPPPDSADTSGAVTTTTSPAHAAQLLSAALDVIFAPGLDDHLIASLPDFWQLYYRAAQTEFQPGDPSVLRQSSVDQKARLLAKVEPPSNEYAQSNGIAGMALYHVVLGADGHPQQIAVGRPIGFGLDENAVDAIRKAAFQPALKDGKPVPVLLDVLVQFRIYSKRTAAASPDAAAASPSAPILPGPYSVGIQ